MVKLCRLGSVALVAISLLFAQSDNTSVNGTVTDQSGAAVPNAKVTLRNEGTGAVREVTTSGTGTYVIPTVPSGTYSLSVEAPGFKKFESFKNKVDANLPATINASLQVGNIAETVTVEATIGGIQTETSTLGRLVEGKQISDLQLNGRNPIFLSLLKPGVRRGNSLAEFSYGLNSGGFNINGSRSQDNMITFDGAVGIRTRANGESIGTADLDAVQEVQILTANYSAEYGRAAGGQIRIITKTGGQDFHGAIYENFRNSELNANSWQRNRNGQVLPSEKFNQFGWNFNGPIYIPGKWNTDKSKVFFFVGQEYVRHRPVSQNVRVVPTRLMKQGNFSELLGPNSFFGQPRIIRDPTTGNPFPNNIIPSDRLSATGLALLSVYPDPNIAPQGRDNWFGQAGSPTNQRKDTYALDVLPTQKDFVKFRMSFFNYFNLNPFQTEFLMSAREFDRPNQTASLNWTRTINPTTVNEFVVTASRDQVRLYMQDTPAFDRSTYGISYPYLFPDGKDLQNKLPTVDISNFSRYTGSPYPSTSAGPIYVISNNTTKIFGTHTIKFGVLWERAGQNDYDQINVQGVPGGSDNQNGRFVFNDTRPNGSGTAVADAALGLFSTYAEIGRRSYTPYRGHMMEWFVQDSWRATSKLKVELGLRHTIIQPYYSLWRNMSLFSPRFYDPANAVQVDPRTGNPIPGTGDPYNGVVIPGDGFPDSAKGRVPIADTGEFNHLFHDLPKYYSQIQKTLFQPRIGIAYQIGNRTVIRSGVGRFSTRLGVSDSVFLGGNPPLQPLASIPNGVADNPGAGSLASFPLSVNTQDPIFKNPESWNWNATVEHELGWNTILEVSYVGRKGLHLQRERNLNQLPIGTVQANPGVNENFLRPYQGFGPIRITNNEASSYYRGLQIGLNRRFQRGFSYGFAYTLAKSTDDGSTPRTILPNAYDASYLWGASNFDNRHTVVANFIYELPFFRSSSGVTRTFLGGWQVSGVAQFQSGVPFSVFVDNDDYAGVGTGSGNPGEGMGQYWVQNGDASYPKQFTANAGSPDAWFSGNFTQPAPGTINTNSPRNQFYQPGFQTWNISAFKNFRMGERFNLQFRADGFNFINHPNWGNVNGSGGGVDRNPRNATFGKVTTKGGERNIQLGLKLSF